MSTKIEWTRGDDGTAGETWNPTSGCDRLSSGCDHCYALGMAKRLKAMGAAKYQRDGDPRTSGPGFGITEHPDTLDLPFTWKKPRRVFVNSMSDLFHDGVSDEFIARVFAVMAATPQHTYQLLSKRHGRMRSLLGGGCQHGHAPGEHFRAAMEWAATPHSPTYVPGLEPGLYHRTPWPLPNVWLGVSVEDQKWADIRIPALLATPAAVRFISAEPLLGSVDLSPWLPKETNCGCSPESRGRHLPSGGSRRVDDRLVGTDLAGGGAPLGSLDVGRQDDSVRTATSGERDGEVPASQGHVRRGSCACSGAPAGLAARVRVDPAGAHRESQEREMGGQPSSELGACDSCRADTACPGGSSTGAAGSVRLAQFDVEADNGAGTGDLLSEGGRRTPHGPRCGVRSGAADDLQDRPRRTAISWLILGGESGPGSRPMHPDWARVLRDQCEKAGVPFFFKQHGAYAPVLDQPRDGDVWVSFDGPARPWQHGDGHVRRGGSEFRQGFPGAESALVRRVGKKAAGRELDGREWDQFPEVPVREGGETP